MLNYGQKCNSSPEMKICGRNRCSKFQKPSLQDFPSGGNILQIAPSSLRGNVTHTKHQLTATWSVCGCRRHCSGARTRGAAPRGSGTAPMPGPAVQCAVQCSAVQCSAVQCSAMQCSRSWTCWRCREWREPPCRHCLAGSVSTLESGLEQWTKEHLSRSTGTGESGDWAVLGGQGGEGRPAPTHGPAPPAAASRRAASASFLGRGGVGQE
jgi:hypothetical protein